MRARARSSGNSSRSDPEGKRRLKWVIPETSRMNSHALAGRKGVEVGFRNRTSGLAAVEPGAAASADCLVYFFFIRNIRSGGGMLMNFGRSKHGCRQGNKKTFEDVAGIEEARRKWPRSSNSQESKKFKKIGGRIPAGAAGRSARLRQDLWPRHSGEAMCRSSASQAATLSRFCRRGAAASATCS